MNPEIELILRLLLAAALGFGIGFQRERSGKPAGLRTHCLIALGAALFTVASSTFGTWADASRIAAGVVAGVGFIGGGVIFRSASGDELVGITTAASIWVTAAVGLAAGAGMYLISFIVALIATLVLMIPKIGE